MCNGELLPQLCFSKQAVAKAWDGGNHCLQVAIANNCSLHLIVDASTRLLKVTRLFCGRKANNTLGGVTVIIIIDNRPTDSATSTITTHR